MTTEASPHTMPNMVSTERSRFRIRACQPCEMSSFRSMGRFLVHPDIARARPDGNLRSAAMHLAPDILATLLDPPLHGGGHGLRDHDGAGTGREVDVIGRFLRKPQVGIAGARFHRPPACGVSIDANVPAAGAGHQRAVYAANLHVAGAGLDAHVALAALFDADVTT